MTLRDRLRDLQRTLRDARLDFQDKWREMPVRKKATIVGGLSGVIVICTGITLWFILRVVSSGGVVPPQQIVLYTSCDAHLIEPVLGPFEAETGLKVRVVGDTEAGKTTGLVQRLLAERDKPRADVWWSNEHLATSILAREGLLEPFAVRSEADFPGGWPEPFKASDRTWYGFALRARVIAYNSNRLSKNNVPTRLRDLTDAAWAGKVGMARPQFGTTRTHIAALVATAGEASVREWLTLMKAQGLRLYDGNSGVVQAIAHGEIDIGLTDTDDCFAADRNNWPVAFVYETPDKPNARITGLPSAGPLVIPNTVARLRGGPNPNYAQRLADYLTSAQVERILAQSDSRNLPVRESLAKEFPSQAMPQPAAVAPGDLLAAQGAADRLIAEIFP
ncbi:MAG: extracellular solute-binding protein [Phycisphaerales bacterium]|nr:extracellular solute-binding protein [Phycisphaerales bacterium]